MRPFDHYSVSPVPILLDGNLRTLELERLGFLFNMGPQDQGTVGLTVKRGRRGKQVEAGPPEVAAVGEVPGGEARGSDVSSD
jgi:hypothetical protein